MYEDRIRQGGKRQTRLKLASASGGTVEIPVIGGNGAVEVAATDENAFAPEYIAYKYLKKRKNHKRLKKKQKLEKKNVKLKEKDPEKRKKALEKQKKQHQQEKKQMKDRTGKTGIDYRGREHREDKKKLKQDIKKKKQENKDLKQKQKEQKKKDKQKSSLNTDDSILSAEEMLETVIGIDEIGAAEMAVLAELGMDRNAVAAMLDRVNAMDLADVDTEDDTETAEQYTPDQEAHYESLIAGAAALTGLSWSETEVAGSSNNGRRMRQRIGHLRTALKCVAKKYKQARRLASAKIGNADELKKELARLTKAEAGEKAAIRRKAGGSGVLYANKAYHSDMKSLRAELSALRKERAQNRIDLQQQRKEDRKQHKASFMSTDELKKEIYAEIDDRNDPEMQLTAADFASCDVSLSSFSPDDFAVCAELGLDRSDVADILEEVNSDLSQDWDEDERADADPDVIEEDEESDPEFVKFDALVTDVKEGISKSKCERPHTASVPGIPVLASKAVSTINVQECMNEVSAHDLAGLNAIGGSLSHVADALAGRLDKPGAMVTVEAGDETASYDIAVVGLFTTLIALHVAVKAIRRKREKKLIIKKAKLGLKKLAMKHDKGSDAYKKGAEAINDRKIQEMKELEELMKKDAGSFEKMERKKKKKMNKSEVEDLKQQIEKMKETLKKEKAKGDGGKDEKSSISISSSYEIPVKPNTRMAA